MILTLSRLTHSQKAFVITFALYGSVLLAVWIAFRPHPTTAPSVQAYQPVPITLNMFTPPTPVVEKKPIEKPIVKPKPVVKPIVKPKPKPKPIKKPKAIPKHIEKPELVKKPVKEVVKPIEKSTPEPIKKSAEEPKPLPTPLPPKTNMVKVDPEKQAMELKAEQIAEATYLDGLKQTLSQYAQNSYPYMAKRRQWQGQVSISFDLKRDGTITNLKVNKPDSRDIFNDAALSIIRDQLQMHYRPFPKEIKKQIWTLSVPISYVLQ